MLVLSRNLNQSVIIDGKIEVKILRIERHQIKLGITAPEDIHIDRKEVVEARQKLTAETPSRGEGQTMKTGAELIAKERQRQITEEGWTPQHDATHTAGELVTAAESYLCAVTWPDEEGDPDTGKPRPQWNWPFTQKWWKPSDDPIRNLVKAGALIAAEIDRLQRAKKQ